MTLLWCDGFDHYGDDETKLTDGVYDEASSVFQLSTANPRTGSYAIRRDSTAVEGYIVRNLNSQNRTIGTGFSFYIDQLPSFDDSYILCEFRDVNERRQIKVYVQSNGSISIKLDSEYVIGQSDSGIVAAGALNHIEVGIYFDIPDAAEDSLVASYDYDFDATDPNYTTSSVEVPPPLALNISTSSTNLLVLTLPTGKTYSAWNLDSALLRWINRIVYNQDGGPRINLGDGIEYDSAEEARAGFGVRYITGGSQYSFYLADSPIADNEGGLSPHIDVFTFPEDGANGIIECRLNGQTVISEAGKRTATTENKECTYVALSAGFSSSHGVTTDIDDWYIWNGDGSWNNTFLGDRRCYLYKPNQDTSISDLEPSMGDLGYEMINEESPDDELTYLIAEAYLLSGSPISGTSEFEIEDAIEGTSQISAINIAFRSLKTDETSADMYSSLVSGSFSTSGQIHNLETTYKYFNDIYEYDPSTISAFTKEGFNSSSVSITADNLDLGVVVVSPLIVSPTDYIARWDMAGNTNDEVGTYNITLFNGAVQNADHVDFDGINDYGQCPRLALNSNQFTIVSRFMFDAVDSDGVWIINSRTATTGTQQEFQITYTTAVNALRLAVWNTSGTLHTADTPMSLTTGVWYTYAFRHTGTAIQIYDASGQVASTAFTGSMNTGALSTQFAKRGFGSTSPTDFGEVDLSRSAVYDYALSDDEISAVIDSITNGW